MTIRKLLLWALLCVPLSAPVQGETAKPTELPGTELVDFSTSFVEWDNLFLHHDADGGPVERHTFVRTQIVAIADILNDDKSVKKRFYLLERYQGEKMWAKDFIFYKNYGHSYSFFFIADVENCEFLIIRNPVREQNQRYQYEKCGYDGKTITSLKAVLSTAMGKDVTSREALKSASRVPGQLVGVSEKGNIRLTYPFDSYNYYIEAEGTVPQLDTGEILYFRDSEYSLEKADLAFLGYNENITEFNFQKPHTLKSGHWNVFDTIHYEYGDIRKEDGWNHKIYLLNGHMSDNRI